MSQTKAKCPKSEQCLLRFYDIVKKREEVAQKLPASPFNQTELRLLTEILIAGRKGERLISTRLAERMNITRSAVSQIVNNLEARGVVVRVADAVDRKIAYIELTPNMEATCKKTLGKAKEYTERLIETFGAEKFDTMCALFEEFYTTAQGLQEQI